MSVQKIIGNIVCEDIVQQENGDWNVIFKYDKKFKETYKKMFNLKKWSKKHFEKKLDEAIRSMTRQIQEDKKCLDLNQNI